MKKTLLTLLLIFSLSLTACGAEAVTPATEDANNTSQSSATAIVTTPVSADFNDDDFAIADNSTANKITLNGDSISADAGVDVNGSTATITAAGVYEISGPLNNGQIVVDTQDAENVTLLLAGVEIHNESGAPIYVANAKKVIITLVEGTQNNVSDGASYANLDESGEPNAAIFSHDDLTINGNGALNVTANYNNGIASKDDLKITGGTITVTAINDGIKGKDSVAIKDGVLTINAGADGIQTTNADKTEKGFIAIEGGMLNITSTLDGIQAATNLSINTGTLTIGTNTGKGINAGIDINIQGGNFKIASADDAIHANRNLTIDDGIFQLASGNGGIRSKNSLTINGGDVNVTQSIEGLESALITINDGYVHLVSSDDGINTTAGGGGQQVDSSYLYINGGYVLVDADGDGLDSNGNAIMTGGVVIVQGPTLQNNGPLDYNGTFNISGGLLVAVGSSDMAEAPSETSTQYSVIHNFESVQAAGILVHIQDQNGNDVLTFMPSKEYQSVVLSSAALQNGMSYTIYTGGTASGDTVDGLYSNSTYTPGTEAASFTIASMVTQSGVIGGGRGGRGGTPPDGAMHPDGGQPPAAP